MIICNFYTPKEKLPKNISSIIAKLDSGKLVQGIYKNGQIDCKEFGKLKDDRKTTSSSKCWSNTQYNNETILISFTRVQYWCDDTFKP